jgi:hypothetical protein
MPRLYTFRERAFVKHGDRFDAASIHVERVFKPMEHVTLPLNAVADRLVPVSRFPSVASATCPTAFMTPPTRTATLARIGNADPTPSLRSGG